MQLFTDSVCAASSPGGNRRDASPSWFPPRIPDPFEICESREFRLRGLAWGISFSAVFWYSLVLALHEIGSLWRVWR